MKRIFLFVLDSFGISALPDAAQFGDYGVHTLAACASSGELHIPNLIAAGLGNIDGVGLSAPGPDADGGLRTDGRSIHGQGHNHRPLGDCRDCVETAAAHVPQWISGRDHRTLLPATGRGFWETFQLPVQKSLPSTVMSTYAPEN